MTSSYQRRLRDIKYYKQCIKELKDIAYTLACLLNENNIRIPLIPTGGIEPTDFITPYNTETFTFNLSTAKRPDYKR